MTSEIYGEDARMEPFEVDDELLPQAPYTNGKRSNHSRKPSGARKMNSQQEAKILKIFSVILSILFIVVVVVLLLTNTGKHPSRDASAAAHTGSSYDNNFNMKQNWGAYSPYFDSGVPFEGISKTAADGEYTLPNTCRYKQVHVLHRHGDRYPAEGTAENMERVAEKIKNMVSKKPLSGNLAWLNDWNYKLNQDLLVGAGVGALFESGAKFWGSHGRLLFGEDAESLPNWKDDINMWANGTSRRKPLLRATTQDRVRDSAFAWAAGFFGTFGNPSSGGKPSDHYDIVLMDESPGTNNSLAGYFGCPNTDREGAQTGKKRSKKWVKIYLNDATTRIQKMMPDYDTMTPEDALAIQDLCVFETAAFGSSAFCGWFTEYEWRGFEYHIDLKFYGESAWGSEVAPATGLPWLAELRARLRRKLIKEPLAGVNVTLASNPETFPLDQPFYADFTHDSVIVSVLSALQFPFTKQDLPSTKIKVPRQLIISRLTPFSARLYVEVLECGKGGNSAEYVRLKLNDRILPIGDLKYCEDDENIGLCSLSSFIKSLDWTLNDINYDKVCFDDRKFKDVDV